MKKSNKSFLEALFGLFKIDKASKNKTMSFILNNDPELKRIRKDIGDINRRARERLEKEDPELLKLLDKYK
jgi:hypothetical protein